MIPSLRRAAWVRIAPFALFMGLLALRGAAPQDGSWGFDVRWLYGVQAALVATLLAVLWREYGELARQQRPSPGQVVLSTGVGAVVFGLWITLDAPWMQLGEPAARFVPTDDAGRIDAALVAVRLAGAAIVVPLMEELFWRSFLMRWIAHPIFEAVDPSRAGARAIVLSTFVFTLVHPQWLAAVVAGLAYALLYVRTGRLWCAVIAHAVTNAALGIWVVRTGNWQFW